MTLSITDTQDNNSLPHAECRYAECRYAECRYAECHYTECRYAECRYAECHGVNIDALTQLFVIPNKF